MTAMTSEELFELCKDHIGKPWWPRCRDFVFTNCGWWIGDGWLTSEDDLYFVEDAIIGSALHYLACNAYGQVSVSSPAMAGATVSFQKNAHTPQIHAQDFSCLLEAVLWACSEVAK